MMVFWQEGESKRRPTYIEDVLVVGNRQYELDDKLAAASYNCTPGAPISVLPADAVVLLVQTDSIWHPL